LRAKLLTFCGHNLVVAYHGKIRTEIPPAHFPKMEMTSVVPKCCKTVQVVNHDGAVSSDCQGLAKPLGLEGRIWRVRVRVGISDPCQTLTLDKGTGVLISILSKKF
jgi:hypothetical protein